MPQWYWDLLDAACATEDMFDTDDLEEFAMEWQETDKGKRWIELVSALEWRIDS